MKTMLTKLLKTDDPTALPEAIQVLDAGGLVAFPTDTVYGLAARLSDPQAIDRLYAVKGRDNTKAIALLLGQPADLVRVTGDLSVSARRLVERFWPGALTLVVAAHPDLPPNLSPLPTVGVRMPDHPFALALLKITGPLAVTSANLSGQASACTAGEVLAQLGGYIPLILDGGRTPGGLSSTVVDCTGETLKILRVGPLSPEEILDA